MSSGPLIPRLPARLLALGCAGLVLLLALAAVSPRLHAWMHTVDENETAAVAGHHDAAAGEEHVCAVTLFAHGVEAVLVFFLLLLARVLPRRVSWALADWLIVVRPHYWLVPSHAPPAV